jgi:hypothetical protein
MALDFPDAPTVGATYTAGGISWTWDGTKWAATGAGTPGLYLPLAGGTMSGALNTTTSGAPSHVDNTVIGASTPAAATVTSMNGGQLAGYRNLIHNGDFRINQRYGSTATTAGRAYITDRWCAGYTSSVPAGCLSFQTLIQPYGSNVLPGSSPWALNIAVATPYTPTVAENIPLWQCIEGANMAHLQWGTPTRTCEEKDQSCKTERRFQRSPRSSTCKAT